MDFKKIVLAETHPSVIPNEDSRVVGVLMEEQRDSSKQVFVPLFSFDEEGLVVTTTDPSGSKKIDEDLVDIQKQSLLGCLDRVPPFLYDVRVGGFCGLLGCQKPMRPATSRGGK